jgi:glycosyltransferase involved in cell wall biosynthesis
MTETDRELVSVIVPAYNAAATLSETLASALAQSYKNLEVIVVDDGSADATAEIAAFFAERDSRVRLLRQSNAGVAAARNLAIVQAHGNYVAPLDADDLWHPEKIASQIATLRRGGPRVGVVYCWRRLIDVAGRVITEVRRPYPHEGNVLAAVLLGNIPGNGSVPLIRRACLLEIGGFDTSLRDQGAQGCEDLRLYLQLAERCDFALVPRFLVGYRATPRNMSSDPRRISRSEAIVLKEARRRHPELPARLFRLAIARAEFRAAQRHLRCAMLIPGLIFLLKAVGRDPVAVAYKLAEKSRGWLSKDQQDPVPYAESELLENSLAPSSFRPRIPRVWRSKARAAPSLDLEARHFFVVSPESLLASGPLLHRYASYAASLVPKQEPRVSSGRDP